MLSLLLLPLFSRLSLAKNHRLYALHTESCVIKVERKSCPGMREKSFKPYNGKTTTEESFQVVDEAECLKQAESLAKIVRKGILQEKRVHIKYRGQSLPTEIVKKTSCRKNN